MPLFEDSSAAYFAFLMAGCLQSWAIAFAIALFGARRLAGGKEASQGVVVVLYLALILPTYFVSFRILLLVYKWLVAADYPGSLPDLTPAFVALLLATVGTLPSVLLAQYIEGKRLQ
jgi:hypothetical protein